MKNIAIAITGVSPLIMHADILANPLSPLTKAQKELTSKRKKTDDDQYAIAHGEFLAGCYWKKETGFYVPGQNLDVCLWEAAKLQRLGVKFKQGAQVVEDDLSLLDALPKTPEALWAMPEHVDVRGVKVGQSKIMRYRPIFRTWRLKATIAINEDVINASEVKKAIIDGGNLIGLCEIRPRFGRFAVEFI